LKLIGRMCLVMCILSLSLSVICLGQTGHRKMVSGGSGGLSGVGALVDSVSDINKGDLSYRAWRS
jgi:hypothetical protein